MFYIVKGELQIQLENECAELKEGDFYIVKKGIKHNPVAEDKCWVMFIEQKSTEHTGSVVTDRTRSIEEQLH